MVLNMLTTGSMIRMGKVYGNLMVNVQATNQKLRERVKHIIMLATGIGYEDAERLAQEAGGDTRVAIVMQKTGLDVQAAAWLLADAGGNVRDAISREKTD